MNRIIHVICQVLIFAFHSQVKRRWCVHQAWSQSLFPTHQFLNKERYENDMKRKDMFSYLHRKGEYRHTDRPRNGVGGTRWGPALNSWTVRVAGCVYRVRVGRLRVCSRAAGAAAKLRWLCHTKHLALPRQYGIKSLSSAVGQTTLLWAGPNLIN